MFIERNVRMTLVSRLTSWFLLTYPVATLTVNGAASAMAIVASLVAVVALLLQKAGVPSSESGSNANRCAHWVWLSMTAPFAAIFLSEAWNHHWVGSALDSPARFWVAVPLFLALRRIPLAPFKWMDLSFALGAIGALLIQLKQPDALAGGRPGSGFLNPIHFGDIALAFGLLSALSIDWWRKDPMGIRLVKVLGLLAGAGSSLLSGSRGGWLAVPVVLVLMAFALRPSTFGWKKVVSSVVAVGLMAGVLVTLPPVKSRLAAVGEDITQFEQGNKDTSVGIRLQLYAAAISMVPQHPVFGLGPNGFADSMQGLAETGQVTPEAAQLGRGEVHNQLLHYAANYGLVGAVALMLIYVVPGALFWRALKSPDRVVRRAGLMGLVFVVAFWVFGLTVETFDLKGTVAFYATLTLVFAGLVARPQQTAPNGGH